MKVEDIRSIGWLYAANGEANLATVLNGTQMPIMINAPLKEVKALDGDKEKMKELAVKLYNAA